MYPEASAPPSGKESLYEGPIKVQLVKIALVAGVASVPAALLSDSKPSEVETAGASAICGSLIAKAYCTFPL